MTPSMAPLVSTAAGAPAPTTYDAALTSLWLHDTMSKDVAVGTRKG